MAEQVEIQNKLQELQIKVQQQEKLIGQMRKFMIDKMGICPFDQYSTCLCKKQVETKCLRKCTNCKNLMCKDCAYIHCDNCKLYICNKEEIINEAKCKCSSCKDLCEEKFREILLQNKREYSSCGECDNDEDDKLHQCRGCRRRVCRFHVANSGRRGCKICDIKNQYKKYHADIYDYDYYQYY
jgi:hypothetical protein